MSEPTRANVEAVADVIAAYWDDPDGGRVRKSPREHQRGHAEALLTSKDPAVLDAMQDALVRAGRLVKSWHEWGVQRPKPFEGVMQNSPPMSRDEAVASAERVSATHDGRWQVVSRWRFYTPWRAEAPDA